MHAQMRVGWKVWSVTVFLRVLQVRELLGYYLSLEEFYLDETANMAIRIDEVRLGW